MRADLPEANSGNNVIVKIPVPKNAQRYDRKPKQKERNKEKGGKNRWREIVGEGKVGS